MRSFLLGMSVVSIVFVLAACADPNVEPVPFHLAGSGSAVAVGANLRIVTEHNRPTPTSPGRCRPSAARQIRTRSWPSVAQ